MTQVPQIHDHMIGNLRASLNAGTVRHAVGVARRLMTPDTVFAVAEVAELEVSAVHAQRRPRAHWVAAGGAIIAIALVAIGDQLSRKVISSGGGCSPGDLHETGSAMFWLAFVVASPVAVIASIVSLATRPRRTWVVVADVGTIVVVLLLIAFVVRQGSQWAYSCDLN